MTYLVMGCYPSYAIVLDNESRMIEATNTGYQEGQMVGEIITQRALKASILFRLAPLTVAACLRLAVLESRAYGAYEMLYGTVEVRVNPGVKMFVSYIDHVVDPGGVNEDEKKLIDQVSYKGRDSEYIAGILVERTVGMGYLAEGGTICVTASGGNERWKAERADTIHTGLDTLLKGGMLVEVYVESIGEDNPSATAPHHRGEMPGGTGGDKPAFVGMPPGGTGENVDGNGEDDKDEDEHGDDTESDDEKNDTDPDKYGEDDGDDREEGADKDKANDKDDGRDDDGKDNTDGRDDDIKKARSKSGRDNIVGQSNGVDDGKDLDDLDERGNGKAGNGLNDSRGRDKDDGGKHSDQDDSDEGDSNEGDTNKNSSQEEDSGGCEDGEDDKDEDGGGDD